MCDFYYSTHVTEITITHVSQTFALILNLLDFSSNNICIAGPRCHIFSQIVCHACVAEELSPITIHFYLGQKLLL